MKPYTSGPYLVGNRFLLDLRTGAVVFHCIKRRAEFAARYPADLAQPAGDLRPVMAELAPVGADPQPLSDDDRLSVFAPAILAALEKPAPSEGCELAQDDPFYGTSAARPAAPSPAAYRVRVVIEQAPEAQPQPARPWTDSDEAFYQTAKMFEAAVYHWYEEGK